MASYHVFSGITAGILALCEEVSVMRLSCRKYTCAILQYAFYPMVFCYFVLKVKILQVLQNANCFTVQGSHKFQLPAKQTATPSISESPYFPT